jgi:hypothetical protein
VLDHVFSFVGGGDYLNVAGVDRRWRGRYFRYCVLYGKSKQNKKYKKFVTRHRSTIMSESRLQHAKRSGFCITKLDLTQDEDAEMICKLSLEPKQVVTVLRVHGVPWDDVICSSAALYRKLDMLQWLHSHDCQWDECAVLVNASRGGSVAMLQWLTSVIKEPWSPTTLTTMLSAAASYGNLEAAQWLRAKGAPWPAAFAAKSSDKRAAVVQQCWSLPVAQWALICGSGWLQWKCQDYLADKFGRTL